MEWDLAVFPEAVSRAIPFNKLLDNLRSMHEEVCARNAQLELQAGGTRTDELLSVPMPKSGLSLRFPFVPNEGDSISSREAGKLRSADGYPSCCLPGSSNGQGPCTPRVEFRDLKESINTLVKQQEELSEKIGEMSRLSVTRASDTDGNGVKSRFTVTMTEDNDCGDAESFSEVDIHDEPNQSRFAVPTGTSKEFTERDISVKKHFRGSLLHTWRPLLGKVLNGPVFGVFSSFLIVSYAGLIGVETELVAIEPDSNPYTIKILHYIYSGIFCVELLLRFLAFGWSALKGADGFWNRVDVCFVLSALVEIMMEITAGSGSNVGSGVVRPVRILRLVRTLRLVRAFRHFHEFQRMAYALLSSTKTLGCSLALLIFVMYFFAVWLTQSAADSEKRKTIPDLQLRYGSVMSTAYTLFLSVSNGISWDFCYMPLHDLNTWAGQTFILYLSITIFGVFNVVTSIFVESVMRSMQHSRDLIVQEKEEEKKITIEHVREVFRHLDADGSGQINTTELEHFLKEPSLRKYMDALDIQADDTRMLFRLLDRDCSGNVSADEFCEGCLRLKGNAKSIDVHALIYQVRAFLEKWGDFTEYVDASFNEIRRSVSKGSRWQQSQQPGCNKQIASKVGDGGRLNSVIK